MAGAPRNVRKQRCLTTPVHAAILEGLDSDVSPSRSVPSKVACGVAAGRELPKPRTFLLQSTHRCGDGGIAHEELASRMVGAIAIVAAMLCHPAGRLVPNKYRRDHPMCMRAEADRVVLRAVLNRIRGKKPHWLIPSDAIDAARSENSRLAVDAPLGKGWSKAEPRSTFPVGWTHKHAPVRSQVAGCPTSTPACSRCCCPLCRCRLHRI